MNFTEQKISFYTRDYQLHKRLRVWDGQQGLSSSPIPPYTTSFHSEITAQLISFFK